MKTILFRSIIVVFIVKFIPCCGNQVTETTDNQTSEVVENHPLQDSVSSRSNKNHLGKMFYPTKPFEVLSFQKGITLEYTGPDDTTECKNWKIRKENLLIIFRNSMPISGTTWDLAFVFTTCVVNGQLKQNGEVFDYLLNAGSWCRVICQDTSLLFGDFNKNDRKYFLYDADNN